MNENMQLQTPLAPTTLTPHDLFLKLLEQLHKDNETLVRTVEIYTQNVHHLTDLAEKLLVLAVKHAEEKKAG